MYAHSRAMYVHDARPHEKPEKPEKAEFTWLKSVFRGGGERNTETAFLGKPT